MDDDALALFTHHTARQTPPTVPFREAALICGRRGGKSRVLAAIAVFLASFRDYTEFLAPGENATIGVIAADRRQARS
jgi:phage terminase large subunit-like protein